MIKHRRWFLSASGAAVINEIATNLLVAAPTTPEKPTLTVSQRPIIGKTFGNFEEDVLTCFYVGVQKDTAPKQKEGGLNPGGEPELDKERKILGQRLREIYSKRLNDAYQNQTQDLFKVLRFSAALGNLTRCMCLKVDKKKEVELTHLDWAREALGFALNTSDFNKKHYRDRGCGDLPFTVKEPDQPCVLC